MTAVLRMLAPLWVLSIVSLAGCAYMPYDQQEVSSSGEVPVYGFATAGNLPLRFQVYSRGTWVTLPPEMRSEGNAYNFWPRPSSVPLFQYSGYIAIPWYYWDGNRRARVRVQQKVGNDFVDTYMYDRAGLDCLLARMNVPGDTFDGRAAGIECSNNRHEVTVIRQ